MLSTQNLGRADHLHAGGGPFAHASGARRWWRSIVVTSSVIPGGMSSGGPVAVEAAVGEPRAVRFAAAEHTHDDVSPVERPRPAPSTSRTMIAGACALCPCVSARRWYRLDEDVPDDDPDASPDVSYVAGKGTSRERRLPLILAPRARWTGSGAEAPHGAATLCPHCHVQNEQLWAERGVAAAAAGPLDSVRRTMHQFDRIMSILAPRHRGGGDRVDRAVSRPRRRAAKNGASAIHPDVSEMSRSAPAATSGADLMMGRAAASPPPRPAGPRARRSRCERSSPTWRASATAVAADGRTIDCCASWVVR